MNKNRNVFVRHLVCAIVLSVNLPIMAGAQEPSIDRLLRKLPPPEKLAGPKMGQAMPAGDPAAKDPLGQKAIRAANLGHFRVALDLCRKLITRYPNSFGAHCLLGMVAWEARQFREAQSAFRRAVAINPRAAFGHFGLMLVEASQGHYAAAIPHLQQLAKLQPNEPIIYYRLSETAWNAGHDREALEYAQKTAALAPSEWVAWAQVARASFSLGDKTAAVKAMARAAEVEPDDPFVLGLLGLYYMHANQYAQALSTLQTAQRRGLKEFIVESEIGHCLVNIGQVDAGLAHIRKGTRKESNYAPGWHYLGLAYKKRGSHQDAVKSFEKATRLAPKWADPWQNLTEEYQALGRAADAQRAAAHVKRAPAAKKKN